MSVQAIDPTTHLDRLTTQLAPLIAGRPGRLCWLQVTAPGDIAEQVDRELPVLLAEIGIDFVDVDVVIDDGEPRILDARFDAGWA